MSDQPTPRLNKIPFLLGDALLLGVAAYVATQNQSPLPLPELLILVGAVAAGAVLAIVPFLVEYKTLSRLVESDMLGTTVRQLQNLESVARNVNAATAQWQGVQDLAAETNKTARQISEQMREEVVGFTEFLKKANDAEKANLRLEVEKLRRLEGDWLQVVVNILDHVAALQRAAAQSGQTAVMQQITAFQHACRDIARRVGVTQFDARSGEEFDDTRHRLAQPDAEMPEAAVVAEVLMPGVAFQGRLLRPAIVTVTTASEPAPAEVPPAAEAPTTETPVPETPATAEPPPSPAPPAEASEQTSLL